MTGSFAPESFGCGGSSALTLDVDLATQPGTHEVRVRGASGEAAAEVTLALIVAQGSMEFALSLTPTSVAIEQSLEATVAVAIARSPNFADDVVLGLGGAPVGIAASFVPNPVTGSVGSLRLQVGTDAAVGVHTLAVTATAGDATRSADLVVTVTERGFTLAGIPSEVFVALATSRELLVAIERTASFLEALTLTIEGAPAGVTGSFVPNPSTTAGSALTLSVADSEGVGSYGLTVRAESGTRYSATLAFSLVVASCPEGGGFSLLLEPSFLALKCGQRADVAVTIERQIGASEPVALYAVVEPDAQHIGVTFDPSLALDGSTMTVAIGINVPPRLYRLVVQGLCGRDVDNATLDLLVIGDN